MASSLETTVPPESTHMGSPPPSHSPSPPPPLQGDHSLPTDAPPEPSPQPHHATPISPPSQGQATKERPRVEEPQPPIDGTPGAAGPPAQPSFFSSLELGTSAAPPAPAATRQPDSPSPHPSAEPSVEFYLGLAASSPSSSSYETAQDDWPAPPPRAHSPTTGLLAGFTLHRVFPCTRSLRRGGGLARRTRAAAADTIGDKAKGYLRPTEPKNSLSSATSASQVERRRREIKY
uniref:Uncharacterized protein n=1 Tax=Oryza rufipogon TaxID=4529 RepID=A0A0E0QSQ7_ORYRU